MPSMSDSQLRGDAAGERSLGLHLCKPLCIPPC